MRTIKFRVFYDGKMIYPKQFLCDEGEIKACFHSDNEVPQIKGPNNECGYEIMQFTGLLDKNGKEIYFDDIVKAPSGEIFQVIWYDDEMRIALKYKDTIYNFNVTLYEVLGNIYEHSNLLPN